MDDVTVVLGDHGADSYTSTIYTLCYRKRGDGPYELSLATATAGSTNPWAGLGGFLLASRIAAVEAQFSDEKLELVPEDEPTRFRLHISFRMTTHLSLFGMYVGQSSYNCDELMYCQVRSPSSVYCQSAGTTERDDGTWKVLGHGHVELTRLANQAS
ncbi:MAG: hypothetical protein Q7S58_21370 [Candidatus Binatus sp.]|uniref:hypothetical protein n=1 Tax=Candidatus Binatus sp. TaxID=2811406 RepID=UPI00271965F2|nr:hypothetical protein [Candidatus Binatus sp.]MDO8434958.1 hypothetical protein [Candidatus Binatus sp.]